MIRRRHALLISGGLLLQACSGGSSGGNGEPVPFPNPLNSAPSITSATAVSVPENTTGVIYTAAASDANSDVLTFSITGADAASFTLDASTGQIAFVSPPDFESPGDTNGDNAYDFTLSVSDGRGGSDNQGVTVSVTDVNETGQRYIDQVFTDVEVQRNIEFAPGLFLDVFSPANDTASDRPVMLVASGGGFMGQIRTSVEPIARDFALRGYVTATFDYRVLNRSPSDADELAVAGMRATHDMFAAVRFARAEALGANTFRIRPDAIFVSGESAGGVMSIFAATLDPNDVITSPALRAYLDANGGIYGNVGNNDAISSVVNGAMPLSGALLDLATVDDQSIVMFAAHEEFDPVVPCDTGEEGSSFTGLIVSGACDIVPAYLAAGANAELYLVENSTGHVDFSAAERSEIYAGAAALFFTAVISP